jgi:hypothetical protein
VCFHGQLRAGGVPGAAVPPVDATPVGAEQATRNLGRLEGFQAGHRLELRGQRPVRQVLDQRGGRGRIHPGPGQHPAQVLDHVRPGPRAFPLLGQRDRLLRRAGLLQPGERCGVRAACARARGSALAVPDRRRDRRQRDAQGTRELVRPARVRRREIQRAFLRRARGEVGRLRQMRELALGRRAAVPLLEPRRAAAQVRGDRLAAGGEHAHHLAANARDLEPVPVVAGSPFQAEPSSEGFLQVLGHDRGDRPDVLVVTERVRGPPLPVGCRPGGVGDLGVDVQLHVTVPRGVLQPVGHRQVRLVPLAGFPAVHPGAVGAGAGVPGLPLEVAEPGVHRVPDHVVNLAEQGGPVLIPRGVTGLAGQAGVLAEGGVKERDGLGQRQGQVEEQGALAGLPGGFDAELALAVGGGVRFGGQQPGVHVGDLPAAVRRPAQRGTVGGSALAEEQVVGFTLGRLTGLEAEGFRAGPHQRPGGSPPLSLTWM